MACLPFIVMTGYKIGNEDINMNNEKHMSYKFTEVGSK